MKIFGGNESYLEQSNKIKQLLGEGTGGRKLGSSNNAQPPWKEAAKQAIHDIAGSPRNNKNYEYLTKFKESLDQRQFGKKLSATQNLFERNKRSVSEDTTKNRFKNESKDGADNITMKQLLFEKRRFSQTRPKSCVREDKKTNESSNSSKITTKKNQISDIIGDIQKMRAMNYTYSLVESKTEKNISKSKYGQSNLKEKAERGLSTDRFESLVATPLSSKRPQTSQQRVISALGKTDNMRDNLDFTGLNYLTPKARLVFNMKGSQQYNSKELTTSVSKFEGADILRSKKSSYLENVQGSNIRDYNKLKRDILNRNQTESSLFSKNRPTDSRVEYTKRFLENALGRKMPLTQKLEKVGKSTTSSQVLGDWFTTR